MPNFQLPDNQTHLMVYEWRVIQASKKFLRDWKKNLNKYYYRNEWELFDLKKDPEELTNIAGKNETKKILETLKRKLYDWLNVTRDPWICSPHSVLENSGLFFDTPQCLPLLNNKF